MLRRYAKMIIALTVLFFCTVSIGAQGLDFVFNGVRLNGALLGGIPVPTGADVEFNLPLGIKGLVFNLRLAGGYEDRMILRNDTDGSPVAKPSSVDDTYWFHWPNAQADAGAVFTPDLSSVLGNAKVDLFAVLRTRYERSLSSLSPTIFPDANNLFAFSFLGGAGIDTVRKSSSRVKSGYAGEISLEYAPKALGLLGGTDFFRASATLEGYLPLLSAGTEDLNTVSLYLASYLVGDYAVGSEIPHYVLTSFGGRDLRGGIGSSIRGYRSWGYEATTKAEASAELRLIGPGLFGFSGLRPLAYIFGDAGYFNGLYKVSGEDKGFVASAGAGAALGVFDFVYVGLRAGYKFPILDPFYPVYFPEGEQFFWGITFLMHF